MWTTGLISDQTYKLLNIFCDFESFVHTSPQCNKILDIASTEAGNIDSYSIFTPTCHSSFASSRNKVMKRLRVCSEAPATQVMLNKQCSILPDNLIVI